jgi:hypothetical protein
MTFCTLGTNARGGDGRLALPSLDRAVGAGSGSGGEGVRVRAAVDCAAALGDGVYGLAGERFTRWGGVRCSAGILFRGMSSRKGFFDLVVVLTLTRPAR